MTENKSFCENDLFREVRVDTRLKLMFFFLRQRRYENFFERAQLTTLRRKTPAEARVLNYKIQKRKPPTLTGKWQEVNQA